jgi:PleD family two-component response regulator
MLDKKALILIAHSDRRMLMAFYTLLDAEGYFVAPCFSKGDLLRYCALYKPNLVMTSNPLSEDEGGRLLENIKERSPKTRILLLPEVLDRKSSGALLEPSRSDKIRRILDGLPVPSPPLLRNGS